MQQFHATRLVGIVLCVILLAQYGVPAVAAEGDAGPRTAFTWHDYDKQLLEFNHQLLRGAYEKRGRHGGWDDKTVAFLDRMAVYLTYGDRPRIYQDVEVPPREQLATLGRAAREAGCGSPLVAYCLGAVLQDGGKLDEARPLLRSAPVSLGDLGYPAVDVWSAARRLARAEPDTPAGRDANQIAEQAIVKMARGADFSRVQRRETLKHIREHMAVRTFHAQEAWAAQLRKVPGVDPWVLDTYDGQVQRALAWACRQTEDDDAEKQFAEHLQMAQERLQRAWKLAPDLPEPAAEMIRVATDAAGKHPDWESPDTWFQRALSAQFDNADAYDAMHRAVSAPWGGSVEQMYRVGLAGAATNRFDTEVPWQFVNVVRRLVKSNAGTWPTELARPTVYDELCGIADSYAEAHREDPKTADWYRTFHAALAWRAGHAKDAASIIERLGSHADFDAFSVVDPRPVRLSAGQFFAEIGPQADHVKAGEQAIKTRRWQEAVTEFTAAGAGLGPAPATKPATQSSRDAQPKPDKMARAYIEHRLEFARGRVALASGAWVSVQPDALLDGWQHGAGEWQVDPADGSLIGRYSQVFTPYLFLDADLGRRYEFSGHTHCSDAMDGGRSTLSLDGAGKWIGWVKFRHDEVVLYFPDGEKTFKREGTGLTDADFVLRIDDGKLSLLDGGKLVIDSAAIPENMEFIPHVGVAVANPFGGLTTFSDLKVRRLTDEPK